MRTLAEKIEAVVTPSRTISLEIKNISSLGPADVEAIRAEFEAELENRGLQVGLTGTDTEVTLSENFEGYVWAAQIRTKTGNHLDLIRVARPDFTPPHVQGFTAVVQRQTILERKAPILDFERRSQMWRGRTETVDTIFAPGVVITSSFVSTSMSHGEKKLKPASGPRDLRGLVVATEDDEIKFFAAMDECVGRISAEPNCKPSSNLNWPFPYGLKGRFVGNRNYFAGFVNDNAGRLDYGAFYTAAIGDNFAGSSHPIVAAQLDGRARLYTSGESPIAMFAGWGDDIVSINGACSARWFVLTTGTGDWTATDRIQAYEISVANNSATATASGQPLEFPGPILAMWQSGDGKTARVMSKNLQTGVYEASIVTVTCSQ